MIRSLILLLCFCSWIAKPFSIPDCHDGVYINDFDSSCNCTGVVKIGKNCNDVLRSGLILQPEGENITVTFEKTKKHAAVVKRTKEGWMLYNKTTDTVIVIRNDLKYTVYFDKRAVDKFCELRSEKKLSKVPCEIMCRLYEAYYTRYHGCSIPSNASNADKEYFKLNKVTDFMIDQDWVFRCSIQSETSTVTQDKSIGSTAPANTTLLTTRETEPASKDSCYTIADVIGVAVVFAVGGIGIGIGLGFTAGRVSKGCSKCHLGNVDRRRANSEAGLDPPPWDGKNVPMFSYVGDDRDTEDDRGEQRKLMAGNKVVEIDKDTNGETRL